MNDPNLHRGIRRREFALWILLTADASALTVGEAADRLEASVIGSAEPDTRPVGLYRAPRFDDFIPAQAEWQQHVDDARALAMLVERNRSAIDVIIAKSSPKWRIERMPPIDRTLLRLGVAEMKFATERRLPTVFHCLIELAKRYGEDSTPRFVNGILDQIRKDLGFAFE